MAYLPLITILLVAALTSTYGFRSAPRVRQTANKLQFGLQNNFHEIFQSTLQLADTSISEEEVLAVQGQAANLPDPLIAVGFAVVVFLGVAVLQFSLGDLTKEVSIC